MAYKCKSCGYRFKSSDSDLCPECFTARDDISCRNFPDGAGGQTHNHFKDNSGGDDFIAKQLREENKRSGDELSEEIRGFTDDIVRKFFDTVPPNTYQRPPQQNNYRQVPPIQITRSPYQQPGETGYQQSAGTGFQTHRSFVAYPNNTYAAANAAANAYRQQEYELDRPVKPQNSVRRIIAAAVFLNIIVMIVTMSIFLDNGKHSSKKSGGPDGKIDCFYLGGRSDECILNGCYNIDAGTPGMLEVSFDKYIDTKWYRFACDMTIKDSWTPDELILEGIDASNIVIFTWTTPLEQYRTENGAAGVPLCFTLTNRYKLILNCTDKKGNQGKLVFEPDLNKQHDDFVKSIQSVVTHEPTAFTYDYDTSAYAASLADLGGSGYKLKLADNPVELTYEPEGKLSFEDDSLPKEDIRLCRVTVVGADGRTPAAENEQALLAGFDAAGSPAYYYKAEQCGELPISSRVKDYELWLTVADREGFDKELHFEFTSNDLYDSLRL